MSMEAVRGSLNSICSDTQSFTESVLDLHWCPSLATVSSSGRQKRTTTFLLSSPIQPASSLASTLSFLSSICTSEFLANLDTGWRGTINFELFILCRQDSECLCQSTRSTSFRFEGILEINMRIIKIQDLGRSTQIFTLS